MTETRRRLVAGDADASMYFRYRPAPLLLAAREERTDTDDLSDLQRLWR